MKNRCHMITFNPRKESRTGPAAKPHGHFASLEIVASAALRTISYPSSEARCGPAVLTAFRAGGGPPARCHPFDLLLSIALGLLVITSGWVGCASHKPQAPAGRSAQSAPTTAHESHKKLATDNPWKNPSDLIQTPPAAKPGPVRLPAVERYNLNNGLKVRVISDRTWPIINLHLVLPASTLDETRPLRSLASFAAQMLDKGTKKQSADQIAEAIDAAGGSLKAWADQDGTHVTCQALSQELQTCLKLVSEVVIQPTFQEKEMAQVRDQLITSVKQVRDNDRQLVEEHFQNALWGDNHVRGWPVTIQSISNVKRKDLVSWHTTRYVPDGSILAVAGDVNSVAVHKQLKLVFQGWKAKKLPKSKSFSEPTLQGMKIRLVDKPDQTQSRIIIGQLGIAHADSDFLPTSLMNYTLGGGLFSSRLMKIIRSEGGKTYGASSRFEAEAQRGTFEVRTFTRNAETLPTVKIILSEIKKMRQSGPTPEELADAQANMAGKYASMFEATESVASAFLEAELHGLPEEFVREYPVKIAAIPLEQVVAAGKNHLSDENLCMVIVGKAEEVEPQLKSAGMEYEKVGYLEPTSKVDRQGK
jgi:zinc protease